MSHSIKKHRRGNLLCFGKKLISRSFMDKWGEERLSRFQSDVFSLSLPKKFVEKPFCVLETFWYRKMLGIREGRVSRFSVQTVLSHSTKKLRRRTLLCFRKIEFRKLLRIRRRYHYSLLINFCPTESKIFVGEHVCVSENFGYRNFLWIKRRGGCITIFCQSLRLTVPKNFVGQTFCVSEKTGHRKNLRIKSGLHYSLLMFFGFTVPKNFGRKHFGVSENFRVRKFFW